jgi:hypothetical protein
MADLDALRYVPTGQLMGSLLVIEGGSAVPNELPFQWLGGRDSKRGEDESD